MIPVEVQTPWQFTTGLDQFDHWQTVVAGFLAAAAGIGAVVATIITANRQIAAARDEADRQIEEGRAQVGGVINATRQQTSATENQTTATIRLQRDRDASEARAFLVMLEAAMARVLAEAVCARETYAQTFTQTTTDAVSVEALAVRKCITKGAFAELRAACVSQGSPLTSDFLDLEREIDRFAMQVGTYGFSAAATMPVQKGKHAGLGEQLALIEKKAAALRQKALEGPAGPARRSGGLP